MMDRLSVFLIFSIIVGVTSEAPLNYPVREVHFKKLPNGSDEYEFEYDLDNGDTFRGQTYSVKLYSKHYFLFGAENKIYWTYIDSNEYKDGEKFTKMVRKVERQEDGLGFEDDNYRFSMSSYGHFSVYPYATKWNVNNTCFTKADNQTFNFTISASNNLKKYNGTTYRETDDPKVQRIHVEDPHATGTGVFEFYFTDIELLSGETFCRSYTKYIRPDAASLGPGEGMWINPKLLDTLIG